MCLTLRLHQIKGKSRQQRCSRLSDILRLGSWISLSSWRGRVNSVARFNIPEADSICCVPSVTKYKEAEIVCTYDNMGFQESPNLHSVLSKSQNETEARYYKYLYRDSTKTCDQLTAEYLLKEDIITT